MKPRRRGVLLVYYSQIGLDVNPCRYCFLQRLNHGILVVYVDIFGPHKGRYRFEP